ncbi:MAG: hypothetical protein ACTHQM_00930 [Thermoanaerobaculia bacterium]
MQFEERVLGIVQCERRTSIERNSRIVVCARAQIHERAFDGFLECHARIMGGPPLERTIETAGAAASRLGRWPPSRCWRFFGDRLFDQLFLRRLVGHARIIRYFAQAEGGTSIDVMMR